MSKKTTSNRSAQDLREYAEICRATATNLRLSLNVILNVGNDSLKDKDDYKEFISLCDNMQKYLFRFYQHFSQCASSIEKNSTSEKIVEDVHF